MSVWIKHEYGVDKPQIKHNFTGRNNIPHNSATQTALIKEKRTKASTLPLRIPRTRRLTRSDWCIRRRNPVMWGMQRNSPRPHQLHLHGPQDYKKAICPSLSNPSLAPAANPRPSYLPIAPTPSKMATTIPPTQTAGWIHNPGPDCVLQIRNDVPVQKPSAGELLVKLECSGICHSDCHNLTQPGKYTEVPGHEGVGTVVSLGPDVSSDLLGKRVGIKWLWNACQKCSSCKQGKENHCGKQKNTGRNTWGTLQAYIVADAQFVTMIPDGDL